LAAITFAAAGGGAALAGNYSAPERAAQRADQTSDAEVFASTWG